MIYHAEFMFCSAFLREVGEIVDYGISITMLYTMIKSVSLSGYDVDTFCRDNGLDPRLLQDPEARIGAEQHVKLACAAAELLEDEHFGLHQGSQMERWRILECWGIRWCIRGPLGNVFTPIKDIMQRSAAAMIYGSLGRVQRRYSLYRWKSCLIRHQDIV